MVKVSKDFVIEALERRYQVADTFWGSEVINEFWSDFVDYVLESGCVDSTPMSLVDNYFVNSSIVPLSECICEGESDTEAIERLCPLAQKDICGVAYVVLSWGV